MSCESAHNLGVTTTPRKLARVIPKPTKVVRRQVRARRQAAVVIPQITELPGTVADVASGDKFGDTSGDVRRLVLADYCRLIAFRLSGGVSTTIPPNQGGHDETVTLPAEANAINFPLPNLTPRQRQTLDRLLAGDSEKQIARKLNLSIHTAHDHVKRLYKAFAVNSRGELLARFVSRAPAP